jgi:glycosyltransferase involved in cell wall biosynthesis
VIVVTDQNRILGALADYADKVVVINGCPPDRRLPKAARTEAASLDLTVAFVGFLAYQRGLGLLLDAAQALPHVRFILIGRLAEPLAQKPLTALPNVEHLGALGWEQCIAELSRADIMYAFYDPAVPINRLAASQKWYDAMMLGIPILSNCEIVNAPWIEQEDIGYTVPYDAAAVIALLDRVSRNPDERQRKGTNGRTLFETHYNWNIMEDRLCSRIAGATATSGAERRSNAAP